MSYFWTNYWTLSDGFCTLLPAAQRLTHGAYPEDRHMAMGRPSKPYKTSWGEIVAGLYLCPDGRWRITETGAKFTETDERLAVAKFKQWRNAQPNGDVAVTVPTADVPAGRIGSVLR